MAPETATIICNDCADLKELKHIVLDPKNGLIVVLDRIAKNQQDFQEDLNDMKKQINDLHAAIMAPDGLMVMVKKHDDLYQFVKSTKGRIVGVAITILVTLSLSAMGWGLLKIAKDANAEPQIISTISEPDEPTSPAVPYK